MDANGFVISRARSENEKGDNFYMNSSYGYALSQGEAVHLYEPAALTPHMGGVAVAQPVLQGGQTDRRGYRRRYFRCSICQKNERRCS
jgi:hypothetical protein